MSKTRKLILFLLSVIAIVALAVGISSCTITHMPAMGISVSSDNLEMELGTTEDITVTVRDDAYDKSWSYETDSSDVISVSKTDDTTLTITAKALGTATITVTPDDTLYVFPEAYITVTVIDAYTVTATPETLNLEVDGEDETVSVSVTTTATDDTWGYYVTPSDESVIKVSATESGDGLTVSPVAAGDATITVYANGNKSKTATVQVNVAAQDVPVTSITASPDTVSLVVGGHAQDVTITVDEEATNPSWSVTSYNNAIVSVTDTGNGTINISPVSHGSTNVVITASDGSGVSCIIPVTVAEFGVSVSQSTFNITTSDSAQTVDVIVTHEDSDDADWDYSVDPSDNSVIEVSKDEQNSTLSISPVAYGTATITVTADGDETKTATITVNVSDFFVSVDNNSVSLLADGNSQDVTVTVTANNSSNTGWTATSSDTDVATVTASGSASGTLTISPTGTTGTAIITVYASGDSTKTATISVTVSKFSISVNPETEVNLVGAGSTATASVTVTAENSSTTTWSAQSSNESVATISPDSGSNGDTITITAVAAGTAIITVTATGDPSKTATITVNVSSFSIGVSQSEVSMLADGNSQDVTVTVTANNSSNTGWTAESSATSVVTVTDSGTTGGTLTITPTGTTGTATITVYASGDSSKYVTITVTVSKFEIFVGSESENVAVDGQTSVTVSVTATNSSNEAWDYSIEQDGTVIEVEKTGTGLTITGKSSGIATITVKASGDSSKTATITVTVAGYSISVTPSSVDMVVGGESKSVTVTVTASNGGSTEWSYSVDPSGDSVITVNQSNNTLTISPVAAGTATITVTASGDSTKTATITVNVSSFSISVNPDTAVNLVGVGSSTTATVTVTANNSTNTGWTAESSATNVATVTASGNSGDILTITAVAAGTATITVTADGDETKTVTITVNVSTYSIEVGSSSVSLNVGASDTVSVTVSVEGTETDTTWDAEITEGEEVVSIDTTTTPGSIIITGLSNGTATITVTATGDSNTKAIISVSVSNVDITSVELDYDTLTIENGDTDSLNLTIEPSGATIESITWSSDNESVVSVSGDNLTASLSANDYGTATITVTVKAADGTEKTAICVVTVPKHVTGITVDGQSSATLDLTINGSTYGTQSVTVAVTPGDATDPSWTFSSSDTNEVYVAVSQDEDNSTLTITAVSATTIGSVTITITSTDNASVQATITVNVSKLVTDIFAATQQVELPVDVSHSDTITVTPSDATDTSWTATSFDPSVATVSTDNSSFDTFATGTGSVALYIMGVKTGQTTITIESSDGNAAYSINVKVVAAETGFSITSYEDTLYVDGNSETFIATMLFTEGDPLTSGFTWNSSNEEVATVLDGVVTPVGKGETQITASYEYEGVTYTTDPVTVTVKQLASITLSADSATLTVNGSNNTATITVTIDSDADNQNWTATSNGTGIASVSPASGTGSGTITITAVATGNTSIIISTADGGDEKVISVSVTNPISDISVSASSETIKVGGESTLTITVTPATPDDGSWTISLSGDTTAVTLSKTTGTGSDTVTVTGAAKGTVTIKVTSDVDDNVYDSVTITVTNPITDISISADSTSIKVGEETSATITVTPASPDDGSWTITLSGDTDAVTLSKTSGTGSDTVTITGAAAGTVYIKVTSDAVDTITDSINIEVYTVDVESVSLSDTSLTMRLNGEETLTATLNPTDATNQNVTWSTSADGIVEIDGTGLSVTIKPVGSGTVTVTVTTEDGSHTASCEITVENHVADITVVDSNSNDAVSNGIHAIVNGDAVNLIVTLVGEDEDAPLTTDGWTASVSDDSLISIRTGTTGIRVTALAGGTATITITPNDPDSDVTVTITVTIIEATISGTTDFIIYESTKTNTLTLNVTNATPSTVTWTSSDTSVATISGSGTSATVSRVANQFSSTTITASFETDYGTVTATTRVCVTANYFYLSGVNQDTWVDYNSSDAAKTAGFLLEASDDNEYVYSVTVHIDLTETLWGFVVCFDGMTDSNAWSYDIASGSAYYDETNSSADYVTSYDGNLQVTDSGDYTITLDFSNDGLAVFTIRVAGIDVEEVTLTLASGNSTLDSTTNTSVTYTYSVKPTDAQYTNDDVTAELICHVDGWEDCVELTTNYSANTVTVTCIENPVKTFTLTLVVTIQNAESNLVYITVNGTNTTAVDHVAFDEDAYAYDVNNGGAVWTTTVHALAYDSDNNAASNETVTYSLAEEYSGVSCVTTKNGLVITSTVLGTFKVIATSNGNNSITKEVEVTFYSDTFYLYTSWTDWAELDSSITSISGTAVESYALTATDSTNKVFSGTFTFTDTYNDSQFYILYLGWTGWTNGVTIDNSYLDSTNSSSNAYTNPGNDHFQISASGTYTITVDLSGSTPVVTITVATT